MSKYLKVNTYQFGLGSPSVFLRCALDLKRHYLESGEMMRPCAHTTLQWHHFWKHDSFLSESRAETAAGIRICWVALQEFGSVSLWKLREWLYLPVSHPCLYTRPFQNCSSEWIDEVCWKWACPRDVVHAHLQLQYSAPSTWKIILMWANRCRNMTWNLTHKKTL